MDAAWPLQGGSEYKFHRHQTRSEQAERALEYGTSLSTLRYERTGRRRSIPRPVNYVQSCHSSNKYTPKPPSRRIQPPSEWHLFPVGSQLVFLHVGSVRPDGLKQIPVSVNKISLRMTRASHAVTVPLGYQGFLPFRRRCSRWPPAGDA